MKQRKNLSDIFHELCENVYFQPPTGLKLKYPCIVYELENIEKRSADNITYTLDLKYSVTYITRNAEDEAVLKLMHIPMCSFGRSFNTDNIYHYTFTIYN